MSHMCPKTTKGVPKGAQLHPKGAKSVACKVVGDANTFDIQVRRRRSLTNMIEEEMEKPGVRA